MSGRGQSKTSCRTSLPRCIFQCDVIYRISHSAKYSRHVTLSEFQDKFTGHQSIPNPPSRINLALKETHDLPWSSQAEVWRLLFEDNKMIGYRVPKALGLVDHPSNGVSAEVDLTLCTMSHFRVR